MWLGFINFSGDYLVVYCKSNLGLGSLVSRNLLRLMYVRGVSEGSEGMVGD